MNRFRSVLLHLVPVPRLALAATVAARGKLYGASPSPVVASCTELVIPLFRRCKVILVVSNMHAGINETKP